LPLRKENIEAVVQALRTVKHSLAYPGHSRTSPVGRGKTRGSGGAALTHSQWAVLDAVKARSKMSVKELAGVMGVSASAATQLVDGLVNNGYLTRKSDSRDRRLLKLSLTPGCVRELNRMKKAVIGRFEAVFKALNDRELASYAKLNRKVAEYLLAQKK
jgi:DNA-binding MarR family transcriptional regulator